MLINLSIRNLVLVEQLELDFTHGMTVLSGETGAGKSILLNALNLTLGNRAQADLVRTGCDRLEVYASFDVTDVPAAQAWLAKAELADEGECILGRTVSKDGRSKASINGRPVTIGNLRELGEMLLDIHGQHEHHGLLRRSVHRDLLDESASLIRQRNDTDALAKEWRAVQDEIETLLAGSGEEGAQAELLRYQVDELDRLALASNELKELEAEHQQLSGASDAIAACQTAAHLISGDDENNALAVVQHALSQLQEVRGEHAALTGARDCLQSAAIQLEEGGRELARFQDVLEINPERLQQVESRLEAIQTLARKHHVLPSELAERHQNLRSQLTELAGREERLTELRGRTSTLQKEWVQSAEKLTSQRSKAAVQLNKSVTGRLKKLGLKDAVFEAHLESLPADKPVSGGQELVEFHVSMNPGQPPAPLGKIASGGELSRTGLAIRVVTAARSHTPTLVFDEVDSGVGGATAEIVGRQLQELAAHCQVLCITHLPQVASLAHAHMQVSKHASKGVTKSEIRPLDAEQRLEEIARMLGGVKVSKQTREHAREMLENA